MTRFAVRKLDEVGVSPLGNLIKADVHHVVAEGNQALAEVAEQRRRAYDKALDEGRRKGESEGGKAKAALMAEAAAAAQAFWRTSEQRLADIVMEAVRRIISEFDDAERVAAVVRQLLGEAADEGRIRIHVAPDQVRAVRDRVQELQGGAVGADAIEVMADAAITGGACRMETQLGFVETSVDAQLEALGIAVASALEE